MIDNGKIFPFYLYVCNKTTARNVIQFSKLHCLEFTCFYKTFPKLG